MKIFLRILDYVISALMGTGTLFLVSLVVGRDWNMMLAMLAGMGLGLLVLIISLPIFLSVSSPFELFPAGMVITMLIGMLSAMAITVTELNFALMSSGVIIFSFVVQLWIDSYNKKLRGEVQLENGK